MTAWLLAAQGASTLAPAGTGARSIAGLSWFLIAAGSIVTLAVSGLVVYAALRRRGNLLEHEPSDAAGGMLWIHIGGIAIPAVILAVTFIVAMRSLGRFPVVKELSAASNSAAHPDGDAETLVVDVTGQQWWWQIRYRSPILQDEFETANELHIPVGKAVRVNLVSRDVNHSFWIPRLHPKMDLMPGEMNSIVLRAEVEGQYRGECAEFCGQQHANMAFLVVAEPDSAFREWAANQRKPVGALADSSLGQGQRLFLNHACAFCHTIRGTIAGGRVAPDLTHVASRPNIAGGLLHNDRAHLEAWILNAPSLKPGTQMPKMTDLDGPSIRALVSYLESLQ